MTIGEFFGTLQDAVTAEWRKHLQTGKYSDHMALDDFYKDMPEKIDALIEAWQADNDVVDDYKNVLDEDLDALQYMEALKKHTLDGRKLMTSPELESLCDDILALIDSTIYKLKHLKESLYPLTAFLDDNMLDLNESVLGVEFDIKDHDLMMNRVHEYDNMLKPSGGNRHGCVSDGDKYAEFANDWYKEIAHNYKKLSGAKAKAALGTTGVLVVKEPAYKGQFVRFSKSFYFCATELINAPGLLNGAQVACIGSCPDFEYILPRNIMSARGCAWVEAYSIPAELAEEIIKICASEWPARS